MYMLDKLNKLILPSDEDIINYVIMFFNNNAVKNISQYKFQCSYPQLNHIEHNSENIATQLIIYKKRVVE